MLKYIVAASCLHLTNSNLQKSNLPSHHTRLCTLSLYDHEYLQRRRPRQLEPTRRGLKGPGLRVFLVRGERSFPANERRNTIPVMSAFPTRECCVLILYHQACRLIQGKSSVCLLGHRGGGRHRSRSWYRYRTVMDTSPRRCRASQGG